MCGREDMALSSAGLAEYRMSKLLPYILMATVGLYLAYEFVR